MEDSSEKNINEIISLTVKYCWALDERDWESLSEVFSPDAYAKYGVTEHKGINSIIEKCQKALVPLDFSHHMVSNHVVEIEGDKARCKCYFQAQHVRNSTPGGVNFVIAGKYEDELVRINSKWKINSRVLTKIWTEGNEKVVNP
ncbi:MAG: nuclear transport factor 2 family protein [Acidimicrobiales bacterium]|nr:nuclear transport factor 2 family protein [Acidimicrobiales bacterium]